MQCFTDKDGCCSLAPKREGEWVYPDDSMVQIRRNHGDFYRTRGANPGVINLVWTENVLIPKGVFCCEIPPSQIACIGVYPEDEGNYYSVLPPASPLASSPGSPIFSTHAREEGEPGI